MKIRFNLAIPDGQNPRNLFGSELSGTVNWTLVVQKNSEFRGIPSGTAGGE